MVREKTFRADLYYRLKVVTILMPPLRERLSDIDDLTAHFIQKTAHDLGVKQIALQDGVIERLKRHPWTGNVRELENVIVAAAIRSRGSMIRLETLESLLSLYPVETKNPDTEKFLSQVETRHIFNTLESVKWNRTRAARILNISLPTLRKKIEKYHLVPPE